ncbi:MAG TPA: M14 family metallopeptidase [Pyrinomonadaceae bacterium]|nr:M14 family metallopeptidase [Pyrinomonadaceae bacterium]
MRPRLFSALALAAALLADSLCVLPLAAQTRPSPRQQPERRRPGTRTDPAPSPPGKQPLPVEPAATAAAVPAPQDVLGFRIGDDRKLASWASIVDYFRKLDAASDRLKFEELGKTTMGAPFVLATISAPENLARLSEFKEIQRQLADPRTIIKGGAGAEAKAQALVARGKTIVLITCGIHSTEVGSTLSSMLIAHRLASSDDPLVRKILQDTIVLLVPSLNPDGVDIVKNWYDRTLGTPYEGTSPPTLYHKYIGHDNNRDWYAFTQVETQLTVDRIHNEWHPQIVHDIHQQGEYGARLFLPPYMQPVEPNVPRKLIEGYTELGNAMAAELRAAGFSGITTDSTYDAWTPARAYSHYHGGVRILSETASARIATPLTVEFKQLRSREGYDPQKESARFGPVWRGGEWRLSDITNYMTAGAFALLRHAADNRTRWLTRFYEIGREAVRERRGGELFAYVIPHTGSVAQMQRDGRLIRILQRGGVEVDYAGAFTAGGARYASGTAIIRMDQPYAGFAKALLEAQHYPDLRDESGQPISPYDVTAHTLSMLMGVSAHPIRAPFNYRRLSARIFNDEEPPASRARLGLYKSHIASMDEGWTRWVIEHEFALPYSSLEDAEARRGNLRAKFDAIIIPDQSPRALMEGHRKGTMPDELTGGLGAEGVRALAEFVEAGGTLICLNRASDFAINQFKLPLRNATAGLKETEFYVPGSILRTELDTTHPVAAGMPRESIAWAEDSPVFELSDAKESARVRVVARYPATADPLLSGWLLGAERIKGKAALVEITQGKGRIYLFGFRPQYRAQSLATYPLLFNAITSGLK